MERNIPAAGALDRRSAVQAPSRIL